MAQLNFPPVDTDDTVAIQAAVDAVNGTEGATGSNIVVENLTYSL